MAVGGDARDGFARLRDAGDFCPVGAGQDSGVVGRGCGDGRWMRRALGPWRWVRAVRWEDDPSVFEGGGHQERRDGGGGGGGCNGDKGREVPVPVDGEAEDRREDEGEEGKGEGREDPGRLHG